jgi:hypothetical protein
MRALIKPMAELALWTANYRFRLAATAGDNSNLTGIDPHHAKN